MRNHGKWRQGSSTEAYLVLKLVQNYLLQQKHDTQKMDCILLQVSLMQSIRLLLTAILFILAL